LEHSPTAISVGHRVAKGALWMIGARFAIRGIGLLSTIIVARLLRPADFGLVALAGAMVAAVDVFGNLSFDVALIRETGAKGDHYDTVWTLSIARGALVALILAALGEPASRFFADERMQAVIYALAASLLLESFQNVGVVDFRKDLHFHREFTFMVAGKAASFVTTVLLALLWRNYWALVCGILAGKLASVALSFVMSAYRPSLHIKEWRALIGFSKWLLITNIIQFFASRLDTFTIGRIAGVQAVGLYEISKEIADLATGELIQPIQRALFPGYAKLLGDDKQLAQSYVRGLSAMMLLALPVAGGIAVVAELIIRVFLGSGWNGAIPLLQILSLSGAMRVWQGNAGAILLARGSGRVITGLTIISTLVLAPCVIIGALAGGPIGAAWGFVITQAITMTLLVTVTLRLLSVAPSALLAAVWRTLISAGVMAVSVIGVREWLDHAGAIPVATVELVALSCFGAVVYAAVHLSLWRLIGAGDGPERDVLSIFIPIFARWRIAPNRT